MGTVKRERQKANRQLRLEELAKQARKDKTKRFSLRLGLALVSVVALVGVLYLLNSDDAGSTVAGTTTTVPLPPAPEKPIVEKPAEPVTELVVTPLREGDGDVILVGDTIDAYYVGITASDGVEFEENYTSGTGPSSFAVGVGGLIKGWDQALVGLKSGGQYRLDIPVDLAYGPDAAASGRPAGDLTFVIDIVGVTHAEPAVSTTTAVAAETPTTSLPAPATT